ncbi:hypothetical protein BpHYR1_026395 [Brachionus plicatilis]|uniref:Uncharacterized protein n=1 Tax=Brachionus plicatilis TaxID=10195 RepID=A0A3M7R4M7_BRAPC|nr:hypothetical protein BpHYR1_026395 [Brachionus plicatilis]
MSILSFLIESFFIFLARKTGTKWERLNKSAKINLNKCADSFADFFVIVNFFIIVCVEQFERFSIRAKSGRRLLTRSILKKGSLPWKQNIRHIPNLYQFCLSQEIGLHLLKRSLVTHFDLPSLSRGDLRFPATCRCLYKIGRVFDLNCRFPIILFVNRFYFKENKVNVSVLNLSKEKKKQIQVNKKY